MEKDMTIKIKYSRTDKIVLGIGYTLLGLFVLAIIVPLVYVVLASFMDPTVLNNQGLSFNIKDWTIDAYRRVLENDMIWRGFFNSFFYSIAFAAISVFVTILAAYPMSKKEFVGRKFFNVILLSQCFWRRNDSYIHPYNQLHMVNTVWAILIPGAFNVWNMIWREPIISQCQMSFVRHQPSTEQMKYSISLRLCFRFVSRLLRCLCFGHL